MNKTEIIAAVTAGNRVCWANGSYEVVKDSAGQWLIVCLANGRARDLIEWDGSLSGKESEFFVSKR